LKLSVAAFITESADVGLVKPYFSQSEAKVFSGVAVAEGVAEGFAEGDGVAETDGDGDGDGIPVFFTPLLQRSFFPLLMHVNLKSPIFVVTPALLQVDPALTAAEACTGNKPRIITAVTAIGLRI
jgi:hypothetical protein